MEAENLEWFCRLATLNSYATWRNRACTAANQKPVARPRGGGGVGGFCTPPPQHTLLQDQFYNSSKYDKKLVEGV